MNKIFKNKKIAKNFIIGILFVFIFQLPMIVLNDKAVYPIDDQFDGEVLTYIISSKNLFAKNIPQLFYQNNTINSLTVASLGTLIFYCFLKPAIAFNINYLFVGIIGYIGMFLLFSILWNLENKEKRCITTFVSFLITLLPYYSVYGISVMGQPLLLYATLNIIKEKKPYKYYLTTCFFVLNSSLILVGYADICILLFLSLYLFLTKKQEYKRILVQCIIMAVGYSLIYHNLLYEILFSDIVGHKSMLKLSINNNFFIGFISLIKNCIILFANGQWHAVSNHYLVVIILLLTLVLYIKNKKQRSKIDEKDFRNLIFFVSGAFLIITIYALWNFDPIKLLRNELGGIFISFQADRFYWLNVLVWYSILTYCLYLIRHITKNKKLGKVLQISFAIIIFANGLYNSTFRYNLQSTIGQQTIKNYSSFRSFYNEELFKDIENTINKDKSDYRVCSIGLHPSIALYNGFYCIDGYSNNYPLEYKLMFRKIIEKELDKNESLKSYFDDWGNRCYVFCDEIGKNYYVTDGKIELNNLELNYQQMKILGCEYVLSSCRINSCEELEFIKKFSNDESLYSIYLYLIK